MDKNAVDKDAADKDAVDYTTFSQSVIQAEIGPPVDIKQSYLKKEKAHFDMIEKEYDIIFAVRVDIDNLLKGFKQRLHVDETVPLWMCFKQLRDLVGDDKTLELSEEGELHIVIDKEACEDAREAVEKFNLMLERCSEYPKKQSEAKTTIEHKIIALEGGDTRYHTLAIVEALERARKQLMKLQEWNKEIESLIKDTKSSARDLRTRDLSSLLQH